LDPISRKETWDFIANIGKEGTKTVITTHYMEEAEALAKEVIIINKGKIIDKGSPQALKRNLRFDKKIAVGKNVERNFLERFGKIVSYGNVWFLYPDNLNFTINELLSKNISVQILPTSLEDVFIEVIANEKK
jgi:ABC-type multidrug transport system ATPase subunit